jgi:hypothetical protein
VCVTTCPFSRLYFSTHINVVSVFRFVLLFCLFFVTRMFDKAKPTRNFLFFPSALARGPFSFPLPIIHIFCLFFFVFFIIEQLNNHFPFKKTVCAWTCTYSRALIDPSIDLEEKNQKKKYGERSVTVLFIVRVAYVIICICCACLCVIHFFPGDFCLQNINTNLLSSCSFFFFLTTYVVFLFDYRFYHHRSLDTTVVIDGFCFGLLYSIIYLNGFLSR